MNIYIYVYIISNFDVRSGIFMLSLTGNKHNPNNIRLHRDDRMAIFKNTSGRNLNKLKKIFQKMFKNKGFKNFKNFIITFKNLNA